MRRIVLGTLLLLGACREGPTAFTTGNPFDEQDAGQKTFNLRADHAPLWNKAGDSIFYDAPTYPGLPQAKGMLLGVPRTGGTARPIMPAVQVGLPQAPWMAGLALSPDGSNAAFLEMTEVRDEEFDFIVCPMPPMVSWDTAGSHSFLKRGVLRVRPVASTSAADAAQLTVQFAGRTGDDTGAITNVAHPFHRLFDLDGVPFFRPTWSPDGARVAFSDGSNIRIWTVGQPQSVVVAGTEDGILPAWSPDGNWIAFSKPFRGAAQTFGCQGWHVGNVLPSALFNTTVFRPFTRENGELVIVRPDGTGRSSLGIGDGPSWTSDSQTIIAHRNENLYRIAVATGAATLIPNTLNAFEPRLSPDGRFLAFARRNEAGSETNPKGNYDIWVAPF